MQGAKWTVTLYLLGFLAVFVWAVLADPGLGGFLAVLREPWGLVVTLDFVFGCLLLTWVIYFIEGSARAAVLWGVALFVIGNIVGAIYLLTRLERIRGRLAAVN
ncbi:MAG: hypothetical protein IT469_10930 [Pseudomonadales bacterium]|nr:hypothetical protein [Pseudomonadales bacterium]